MTPETDFVSVKSVSNSMLPFIVYINTVVYSKKSARRKNKFEFYLLQLLHIM